MSIHLEGMLKISGLSLGIDEIPQRGAPLLHRHLQDVLEIRGQTLISLTGDTPAGTIRTDSGSPCGLIGVDIANSGDDAPIEQIIAEAFLFPP